MKKPPVVIITAGPDRAEADPQAGSLACPACGERLRAWSGARSRTVRLLGAAPAPSGPGGPAVRTARVPGAPVLRVPAPPADATEVIATALRAKVSKSGYRHIAVDLNRPPCTVRRWLRAARPTHLTWLRQQGVQALAAIDLDLPNTIDLTPTDHGPTALQPLRQALNVLATAALAIRRRLPALATDIWTLIGAIARGQLIPAARPG